MFSRARLPVSLSLSLALLKFQLPDSTSSVFVGLDLTSPLLLHLKPSNNKVSGGRLIKGSNCNEHVKWWSIVGLRCVAD